MHSLERIVATVHHQPIDRTPVVPVMLMQGARMLDVPLSHYFQNPARLAEGQLRLLDRFGHDAVFAIPHIVQDVLPWGATLDFHDDGPPSVNSMVIQKWEEILALPVPDPACHPYTRATLQAAEALAKRVGSDTLIVGAVIGPFSLPTMLMGMKRFLQLLTTEERIRAQFLPPLLEKSLEFSVRWAKAQQQAGCHLIVFAEGAASASILDEKSFLKFAKPVLEAFVKKTGGLLALEFVGHCLPFLKHVADIGAVAYLVGESEPLAKARQAIGPQMALMGNLNNLKLMRWEAERVEFEARRAIASAGSGFILANQGPEIAWDTPDANIEALIRAAHTSAVKSPVVQKRAA